MFSPNSRACAGQLAHSSSLYGVAMISIFSSVKTTIIKGKLLNEKHLVVFLFEAEPNFWMKQFFEGILIIIVLKRWWLLNITISHLSLLSLFLSLCLSLSLSLTHTHTYTHTNTPTYLHALSRLRWRTSTHRLISARKTLSSLTIRLWKSSALP